MLILASITIGAVSGEGGLIGSANEAKEKTEIANEKEVVDRAVVQAMGKNKRGNLVRSELQDELDKITGEGETEVTIDEVDYGYFVKFLDSGRIYKVSRDGDVEYLGKEDDLLTQANIIANPESNTTPEFIQTVELTVETPIDIGDVDFMLVSAWSQDKNTAPEDSEFQVATLQGEGRRRTTTVNSSASVGGDYYLWVRVVVGEIEKEECFGPYAIKDSTTLVATSTEDTSESNFLGMPIERGLIQSVEIKNTLVGTGHSLGDGNTYDVTEGEKGKYLGWYEQNENGYYDVTIAGEGEIVANRNSSYLFANIGYGITDTNVEVTITGLEYLDTGLVNNTNYMFNACKATELDVTNFDTKNVIVMWYMFNNCSNIEELDLSKFNTEKVNMMANMFSGCTKLKSMNINSFITSNVTNMSAMFSDCNNLRNLNISSFDTRKVTNMSRMFNGCSSLTNLDVSSFNTSNVTSMDGMFRSCKSLTELDLNNFDTSNVTSMSDMFYNCTKLVTLNIDNFNTIKVTNIGRMFWWCSSLTNLDVSSFKTNNVTSMERMFANCSKLTNLNVTNFDTSNVKNMNSMFSSCSKLTNIDLSKFNTSNVTDMQEMFGFCSGLTSLDVSEFDTSNVKNMYGMFNGCSNLIKLDLSNFNTSKVTSMGLMFSDCGNLKNLNVSNFNTNSVTSMYRMFINCSSLENLDLSSFNTINVTNMESMFHACNKLEKLNLAKFDTSSVSNIYGMFNLIPTTIEIITNTTVKDWILEHFPSYTNIMVVN